MSFEFQIKIWGEVEVKADCDKQLEFIISFFILVILLDYYYCCCWQGSENNKYKRTTIRVSVYKTTDLYVSKKNK